ncbi:hypothetical protein ACWFMI_10120 [Nocardiopsis terrae]
MSDEKYPDPRNHVLSRQDHSLSEEGEGSSRPLTFAEEVNSLRSALEQELSTKVEERSRKTELLASEALAIIFLLDEFSARVRLQVRDGGLNREAEALAELSDKMSQIVNASMWAEQ